MRHTGNRCQRTGNCWQLSAKENVIEFDPAKCKNTLGVDVPESEQEKILTLLGFDVKIKNGKLHVRPPSWRPDIAGAEDMVEEIIRVKGYEHIPALSLPRLSAVTQSGINRRTNALMPRAAPWRRKDCWKP